MTEQIHIPPGLLCVTTYGPIRQETAAALMELRSVSEASGLKNVAYQMIPGALVEKARNDAVRTMLAAFKDQQGVSHAQWLLQVDGDMTFAADALQRILTTAYGTHHWADAVGGYCTLKGEISLPTCDTGTGTWESIFPGRGVIEVIRTGTAFLLVKRHVFERLEQPWFRTRAQGRQLDVLLELDNFARCKLDGQNPFRNLPGKPWEKLEKLASEDPSAASFTPQEVGEDSGFCDRVRKAGMRIVVNTDIEIGHVDTKIVGWRDHKSALEKIEAQWLQAVGVA